MLSNVCGFRTNVRILRTLGAWQRKRKPDPLNDYITGELERIRLRDTVGVEIAGLAVGILMCLGASSPEVISTGAIGPANIPPSVLSARSTSEVTRAPIPLAHQVPLFENQADAYMATLNQHKL